MASPTSRSLKFLRDNGYIAEVVERWIPGANIRRDLFHCADIVAIKPEAPIMLVQSTSASNVSARIKKSKSQPELSTWLACQNTAFEVHGWGEHNGHWECRRVALNGQDCEPVELTPKRPRRDRKKQHGLFDDSPDAGTNGDEQPA